MKEHRLESAIEYYLFKIGDACSKIGILCWCSLKTFFYQ